MSDYVAFPFIMSTLSVYLRIESYRESSRDSVTQELDRAFDKEFAASQKKQKEPQLNYSGLFGTRDASLQTPLSPHHLPHAYFSQWFRRMFQRLRQRYRDKEKVLFPKYQKKKNVSRDTEDRFWSTFETSLPFPGRSSYDLEKHYSLYGEQIQGVCEMRSAFRFTDLKPRIYYCCGGTDYWASRFIRDIVTDLCNMIPACHMRGRTNVDSLNAHVGLDSNVTIYDYSSFTTSLSELKNFLYHLGEAMRGILVYTVDDREGLVTRDAGQMILDYNETVNIHSMFDVERLRPGQDSQFCTQMNSGMLGVQGNIGFSTLLHAINLCAAVDDVDTCKVMGDDAIVVHDEETRPLSYIRTVVNLLGEVAEEKFASWNYREECQKEYGDWWHYCKRPITVTQQGIEIGVLYDFPNPAYAFNLYDDFHKPLGSARDRTVGYIMQVASFMRKLTFEIDNLSSFEMNAMFAILGKCYQALRLPIGGSLPGRLYIFDGIEEQLKLAVPPITFEAVEQGWESNLWDTSVVDGFLSPAVNEVSIWPTEYEHIGQEFVATDHRLTRFMEDFGYMKSTKIQKWYDRTITADKHSWLLLLRGHRHVSGLLSSKRPQIGISRYYIQYL
ncbi:TPA_asm: hypothetical protein [Armillaria ectypa ambi-like virus 1]|uniref:RNA-directed RNA polymerase n=1 Tax=Armillaria ectypa ambi-like virus 1 TaxID=2803966 RepID=A0A8D9PD17_9VIRU|nr:TPA_asm: hypothetical protein [Armillaria ectypa ambi-like virus 1]